MEPKRLFSKLPSGCKKPEKMMFDLSSTLPTQFLPRAILAKRSWNFDVENNETRLFMHVNHPDNLREACSMARDVVCSADTLSDLLVSADLDVYQYINQRKDGLQAQDQRKGIDKETCYAYACATVIDLVTKRIVGRQNHVFERLKDEMVKRFRNRAQIPVVLREFCRRYNLRFEKVSYEKAREAIRKKRPVVASFLCTVYESDRLYDFFSSGDRSRILTKQDLGVSGWMDDDSITGHAVVLTSYSSSCLTLMNSWGDDWGENGFFRVQNAEVFDFEFYDVYWKREDLSNAEQRSYDEYPKAVAGKLMRSLKCLMRATYICPMCKFTSPINNFTGTVSQAKCPDCKKDFSAIDNEGNVLALNVYLTSITKPKTE